MRRWLISCLFLAGAAHADSGDSSDDDAPPDISSKTTPAPLRPSTTLHRPAPDKPSAPNEHTLGDKSDTTPPKLNDGTYQGVALGADNPPPRAPKLPVKGPQRLTWSGFQVKDGVPTVFLQLTGTPDYTVAESAGSLTVTLRNTTIPIRNNRRPLRVEAFDTTIKNIVSTPHGKDVHVVIQTKSGVSHKERTESANGYQMLIIEVK